MICEKSTYDSYKQAVRAIVGISARTKEKYKAYGCPHCSGFHITTIHRNKLEKPAKDQKYKLDINNIPKKAVVKAAKPHQSRSPAKRFQPKPTENKMLSPEQAAFLKQLIKN